MSSDLSKVCRVYAALKHLYFLFAADKAVCRVYAALKYTTITLLCRREVCRVYAALKITSTTSKTRKSCLPRTRGFEERKMVLQIEALEFAACTRL